MSITDEKAIEAATVLSEYCEEKGCKGCALYIDKFHCVLDKAPERWRQEIKERNLPIWATLSMKRRGKC